MYVGGRVTSSINATGSVHPPIDRAWGMREFAVATPDGHRLMVGEILPS